MKRSFLLTFLLGLAAVSAWAQKMVATEGYISFYSAATIEDIKAENHKVTSIFEPATGRIAFSVPIRDFQFEKSLMQEHFNDKYMESEKYPRSTFSGTLNGFDAHKKGPQDVTAMGDLIIHGVTKNVTIPGTVEVAANGADMTAKFVVRLADYSIDIPQLLWQNIAEQVEVTVKMSYKTQ